MRAVRSLGLERHEEVFRDNKIDDTILPSLTTEALSDGPCCPR